jgi:hypothetical protein
LLPLVLAEALMTPINFGTYTIANPSNTNEPTIPKSPIDDVNRSVTLNGNVTPVKSIALDAGGIQNPSHSIKIIYLSSKC